MTQKLNIWTVCMLNFYQNFDKISSIFLTSKPMATTTTEGLDPTLKTCMTNKHIYNPDNTTQNH